MIKPFETSSLHQWLSICPGGESTQALPLVSFNFNDTVAEPYFNLCLWGWGCLVTFVRFTLVTLAISLTIVLRSNVDRELRLSSGGFLAIRDLNN